MNPVERLHEHHIKRRRVRGVAAAISAAIPGVASVLDVGCGDGLLAEEILRTRPDVTITGLEICARPGTRIPVNLFDGIRLPYPDLSVDVVLFADVLHHTPYSEELLREARRVARKAIVIKDHCADGFLSRPTLRFMDHVGNARFGVPLPNLYLSWAEWGRLFDKLGLSIAFVQRRLRLYPAPVSWLFDRSLHFVVRLTR